MLNIQDNFSKLELIRIANLLAIIIDKEEENLARRVLIALADLEEFSNTFQVATESEKEEYDEEELSNQRMRPAILILAFCLPIRNHKHQIRQLLCNVLPIRQLCFQTAKI